MMAITTMTAFEAKLWAPSVTPTMMESIGSTSSKTKTKGCGSDEWICELNSWPAPLDPECRGDWLESGFKKDLERHVEALYTRNSHLLPLVSGENRWGAPPVERLADRSRALIPTLFCSNWKNSVKPGLACCTDATRRAAPPS